MSRERDGGREPRKDPASRLISDQEQAGRLSDPLRFGPEREPEPGAPRQRRPDWKQASARKVREATAEPERREDAAPQGDGSQPVSEPVEGAPPLDSRAATFPPDRAAEPVPQAEHGEPPGDPREAPRGPERLEPRQGPAARLRFEDEAPADDPGADTPKGPRPAGRGPAYSQEGGGNQPQEAPLGQSVPKDGSGKFRMESQQEQINRSKFRMEKQGAKLDKARDRLAKQKPPKKKGLIRKAAGAAGWTAHGFVHGKIYENEHENVGIEGAHRSELVGESALRHGSRFVKRKIREHPAKAVQKAESRYIRATADYHFHTAAQEHPELSKNALSRFWQKRRLRKRYQKQAKEAAKYGAQAAGKTAVTTEKLAARAVGFVKRHPVGCLLALACVLLVLVMQSCSSSLVTLGNSTIGAVGASTYPCEDGDLLGAEAAYCDLEAELSDYLDSYESTHDYDEYHFDLDEIEHDPYVLLSLLCSLHEGQWTLDQVEGSLQTLFDSQYILTEDVVVEVRYRTETHTDSEGNDYEVEVPYNYYICYVTLENKNLSHLPVYVLSEDQMSRYAIYMATLGNRPDLFPGSEYVGKYTETPDGYEVPGEYLDDETFAAMLSEAQKYIGYPYVWGGSSPSTSFDCSGYVSWVINHSGWNVGRLGAQGLYNICTPTSNPKPGDLVFFVGTYDTAGVSHCGIYVGDGMMIHCGDPIQYANLNTSYWQSHFYAYGRLP